MVAYHSFYLMDDQVLVEPDIGTRPFESARIGREGTARLLGPGALNLAKEAEEGAWETRKINWGVLYDTEAGTRSLPEAKLQKAYFLVNLREFDAGCERIPRKLVQQLRGNQQYWTLVLPCLAPMLGATDALLAGPDGGEWAEPQGSPESRRAAWEEFWDSVAWQRVMVADPGRWALRFTTGVEQALSLGERLSLPGAQHRIVWVTGDATPSRLGTVDWTFGVAAASEVKPFLPALSGLAGTDADETELMIALAELLNLVTMAAARGGAWASRIILYVGDNSNVNCWLGNRKSSNRCARFLLQLLGALEACYGFSVSGNYARTYHNITADALTRCAAEDVEALLASKGLRQIDLVPAWEEHLSRGWIRRALTWDGQDGSDRQLALQLASGRSAPPLSAPLAPRPSAPCRVVEWRGAWGGYARAALSLGCEVALLPSLAEQKPGAVTWPPGVRDARVVGPGPGAWDVACASLGPDRGEEARRFASFACLVEAAAVVMDAPRSASLNAGLSALEEAGYVIVEADLNAADFGDVVALRRRVILAARGSRPDSPDPPERPPGQLGSVLQSLREVPADAWLLAEGHRLELDPRIVRRGGPSGAMVVGRVSEEATGERRAVFGPQGPAPAPGGGGPSPLVLVAGGPQLGVRPILPAEWWKAFGGLSGAWLAARAGGASEDALLGLVRRSAPPQLARALLEAALEVTARTPRVGSRAGACRHPGEAAAWNQLEAWLQAWKRCPASPSLALQPSEWTRTLRALTAREDLSPTGGGAEAASPPCGRRPPPPGRAHSPRAPEGPRVGALLPEPLALNLEVLAAQPGPAAGELAPAWAWGGPPCGTSRCGATAGLDPQAGGGDGGARRLRRRARSAAAAQGRQVQIAFLGGPEAAQRRHAGPPVAGYTQERADLDRLQFEMVLDRLAESTRRSYGQGWRWWALFCKRRGIDPYRVVQGSNREAEQAILLDFLTHLWKSGERAPGTIKVYLSSVRAALLAAGCPDPTQNMPRLWMALDGLKKRYGSGRRKKPVSPRMLRRLFLHLDPANSARGAILWGALLLAYFFLLRSSEYLCESPVPGQRGLRGSDVIGRCQGAQGPRLTDCDEVVLTIRGSKTDKFNMGETRNHFRNDDPELCVVKALALLQRWFPARLGGQESHMALFRDPQGKPLHRAAVQDLLRWAARAEGLAAEEYGTHSLRFGGASALWAAYGDSGLIQRWGRWASSCFQGYIWEARGASEGVSAAMAKADFEPV